MIYGEKVEYLISACIYLLATKGKHFRKKKSPHHSYTQIICVAYLLENIWRIATPLSRERHTILCKACFFQSCPLYPVININFLPRAGSSHFLSCMVITKYFWEMTVVMTGDDDTCITPRSCVWFQREPSWSWSSGSRIYNYIWNQFLSSLKLCVRTTLRRGVLDFNNSMW